MTLSTKKSIGNGLILILKGMAMGIANKVPGFQVELLPWSLDFIANLLILFLN